MSETGKEVKCSVYSKLKKIASSEEEKGQKHHHTCTSTVCYAIFRAKLQPNFLYSLFSYLQREDQTSAFCLPPSTEIQKVKATMKAI